MLKDFNTSPNAASENVALEQVSHPHQNPFRFFPDPPPWKSYSRWVLEIGPGNGAFLVSLAAEREDTLCVALELRYGRFMQVAEKIEKNKLKNAAVVHADARVCLPAIFEKETLSEIFVLFPDPWPKRRQQKHRLLNEDRVALFHRLLQKGGMVWVGTDHAGYAGQIHEVFHPSDWEVLEGQSLYPTYFETRWKKMGCEIFYFCFRKKV